MPHRDKSRIALRVLLALWLAWYAIVWIARPAGDLEEAVNGNLAVDLLRGPVVPVWYYQYQPWAHGPLLFGFLLTPLFALFGSTMAAVKFLGAVFAAWGTGVWTALVRRAWGGAAAILFLLWWLLPPPYLGRMLHVVWANHMETIALGGTILWLFLKSGDDPPSSRSAFAQGLFAGFASFFCLQALAFAFAVAACGVWRWRRAGLRTLTLFAAPGFAVGIAPRLAYRLATGADYPVYPDLPGHVERFVALFADVFPIVSGYSVRWGSIAAMCLALISIAVLAIRSLPRRRSETDDDGTWFGRALVLYIGIYLLSYTFGPHAVLVPKNPYWHRYVLPLAPVGMAAVCWALTRPRVARLGWLALVPLLVLGGIDQRPVDTIRTAVSHIREGTVRWRLTAQRGDDYARFVYFNLAAAWEAEEYSATRAAASVEALPEQWRASGAEVLGRWVGVAETVRRLTSDPGWLAGSREHVARGAGIDAVDKRYAAEVDRTGAGPLLESMRELAETDDALADAFIEGTASELTFRMTAKYGLIRTAPFLRGETDWADAPMVDTTWREVVETHRDLLQALAASLSDHRLAALVRGAGRRLAFDRAGPEAFAIWCGLLAVEGLSGHRADFARGEAEGTALRLLSAFDHFESAELTGVDAGDTARALARRGVTMRAVTDPRPGWVLVGPDDGRLFGNADETR